MWRPLGVLYRRHRPISPAQKQFVALLKEPRWLEGGRQRRPARPSFRPGTGGEDRAFRGVPRQREIAIANPRATPASFAVLAPMKKMLVLAALVASRAAGRRSRGFPVGFGRRLRAGSLTIRAGCHRTTWR